MKLKDSTKQNIPIDGTLGILAYGYRGIIMWRRVRLEAEQKKVAEFQKANQSNEKN